VHGGTTAFSRHRTSAARTGTGRTARDTVADIITFTDYRSDSWLDGCSMDIFKNKLPAGWAYALKPSLLESAVTDAGVRLPVALHQRHKVWAADAPALRATFHPRGSHLGKEEARFSITSAAIPSDQRGIHQDFVERVFLPALIQWMVLIEALPNDSTVRREEQAFVCDGGPIALAKRPLWLARLHWRR